MKDYFVVLGRIFIFSTLLPGGVGCAVLSILFPELRIFEYGTFKLLIIVYALGFGANAIGHFIDDFYNKRRQNRRWPHFPFLRLMARTNNENLVIRKLYFQEVAYVENLRDLYFNSAIILTSLPIIRIPHVFLHVGLYGLPCFKQWFEWIVITTLYIFIVFFLFKLAQRILDGINEIIEN